MSDLLPKGLGGNPAATAARASLFKRTQAVLKQQQTLQARRTAAEKAAAAKLAATHAAGSRNVAVGKAAVETQLSIDTSHAVENRQSEVVQVEQGRSSFDGSTDYRAARRTPTAASDAPKARNPGTGVVIPVDAKFLPSSVRQPGAPRRQGDATGYYAGLAPHEGGATSDGFDRRSPVLVSRGPVQGEAGTHTEGSSSQSTAKQQQAAKGEARDAKVAEKVQQLVTTVNQMHMTEQGQLTQGVRAVKQAHQAMLDGAPRIDQHAYSKRQQSLSSIMGGVSEEKQGEAPDQVTRRPEDTVKQYTGPGQQPDDNLWA